MDNINSMLISSLLLLILTGCMGSTAELRNPPKLEPFAVSYEKLNRLSTLGHKYRLLVVEPDHYSKIEVDSLNTPSNKLLAYITLGEVNPQRWYYPLLEERGFLGINKNWDSPYINLADTVSQNILLKKVLPNIMVKGFDGLFLDTVDDVAPYTERAHLQPQMVEIIKTIRQNYPEAFIVQNAGLFLLDKTSSFIDAVLVEDVATSYNFENMSYNLKEAGEYRDKVDTIRQKATVHNLPFLIVDFAINKSLRSKTISRLDTLPHPYFIGSIQLNSISRSFSSSPSR